MKVVYYLMTHRDEPQIRRLAAHLCASPRSFVLVHHDAGSAPLTLRSGSRLHVLDDPVAVEWGDVTQVHAMLRGMEWLERTGVSFDWMILLSGQDYPVRPLESIEAELEGSTVDGYLHYERIHDDPGLHTRYFQKVCWERYFFRTVRFPRIGARRFRRRHPFGDGMRCFAGSQWLNLSYRAVERVWERRPEIDALVRYLRNASCPDEVIFQTILGNEPDLVLDNTNRRFILWRDDFSPNPEILTLEDLEDIRTSDAWFARKMEPTVSSALLDALDDMLSPGKHPPPSTPDRG